MATIDRIIQFAQDHINYARQELMKTRQFTSRNEHDLQDLRSMLQRSKLMGDNKLDLNFGSMLCNYIDGSSSLRNSQNALATHLSLALSFIAEVLELLDSSRLADVSYYSYISVIRRLLSDIRFVLSDYDIKQIPKDGIASGLARVEAITKMSDGTRFSEISEMLRGIRQAIAYY